MNKSLWSYDENDQNLAIWPIKFVATTCAGRGT
jgi:hypothetical protein